jgi:glucosamine-6-phosphate deaminase
MDMNKDYTTFDQLKVRIFADNKSLGTAAATMAADIIAQAIDERGIANVILATGNSQLTFLHALRQMPGINWPAVNVFHMDEYLRLPPGHPAGFPAFLHHHLLKDVPVGAFYPVPGHATDVATACEGYELLLRAHPTDLCCLGIGENGHLAFNDPPLADFDDPSWLRVVNLTLASRLQQVGEGHFTSLEETPTQAITLTIPALRAARKLLCIVPEARKAHAVWRTLTDPVSSDCPASILRQTPHAYLLLDRQSASELPASLFD